MPHHLIPLRTERFNQDSALGVKPQRSGPREETAWPHVHAEPLGQALAQGPSPPNPGQTLAVAFGLDTAGPQNKDWGHWSR